MGDYGALAQQLQASGVNEEPLGSPNGGNWPPTLVTSAPPTPASATITNTLPVGAGAPAGRGASPSMKGRLAGRSSRRGAAAVSPARRRPPSGRRRRLQRLD